jgi:hypothetical protein
MSKYRFSEYKVHKATSWHKTKLHTAKFSSFTLIKAELTGKPSDYSDSDYIDYSDNIDDGSLKQASI